ncbi:hypothetical protein C8J56DRAFT_764852, partial [Mycena floridula]
MIGCPMLCDISAALSAAKENDAPFGGINIIFAGDFAQLPPVKQARLYSREYKYRAGKPVSAKIREKNILGRLLWLSIRKVVTLTENMRQKALENNEKSLRFIDLLQRLLVEPDWNSDRWKNTPIIVNNNESKDALNNAATYAFAHKTGRPVHMYYPTD